MTLLKAVNKKCKCNVFITVISKVITSKVFLSFVIVSFLKVLEYRLLEPIQETFVFLQLEISKLASFQLCKGFKNFPGLGKEPGILFIYFL
jgi:hypothetical protein